MNFLATLRQERTFFAKIFGEKLNNDDNNSHFEKPLIQFFFLKPFNCVLKISKIIMSHGSCDEWIRMKPDQQDKDVSIFVAKMDTNVSDNDSIKFRVHFVNSIENFGFVDATWITDLWSENQLADVDVLVGQNKLRAHRIVLSARSPVFNILLSKQGHTGKSKLTFDADAVDFSVVEQFLKYLYTGTLSISAKNKQLLALAETYQVESLKKICQLAVRVSDVEDITNSFIALF